MWNDVLVPLLQSLKYTNQNNMLNFHFCKSEFDDCTLYHPARAISTRSNFLEMICADFTLSKLHGSHKQEPVHEPSQCLSWKIVFLRERKHILLTTWQSIN